MTARVYVTLKKGVLDPQGKAVERSLAKLGFGEARDVRVGRFIEMAIEARSREEARERVDAMCRKLLANTVIEDYRHPFHNPGRTTAWS
jgi:phosphoribosylformylglycinamidine synthase PurS subunit